MKTLPEYKFTVAFGDVTLPTRMPVVGPCSHLHQRLRELLPELSALPLGTGIYLDWPKWSGDSWIIEFGDEHDDFCAVHIRFWKNGQVKVILLRRNPKLDYPAKVSATYARQGRRLVPRKGVELAFDHLFELAPKIAEHLRRTHKPTKEPV